jgi:Arc/MetJ family transcription regulator
MATNLAIDMELLDAARKAGGFATKKETVNRALAEFVQRRKAMEIIDLFGTVNYDGNYDYKAERRRDP